MELGQDCELGKTKDSFQNITDEEGFAVTEERKETK